MVSPTTLALILCVIALLWLEHTRQRLDGLKQRLDTLDELKQRLDALESECEHAGRSDRFPTGGL